MTEPTTPHGTTSTLPPPAANRPTRSPPAPQASAPQASAPQAAAPQEAGRAPLQTRLSAMRTTLIAGSAALIVAVIFVIQNVHAANISFLGIHLVLPLAGALLLAAIAGSLLTVAAGPARITGLRQIIGRAVRKARAELSRPQ
jgi:uncharacterized integral membrane protein